MYQIWDRAPSASSPSRGSLHVLYTLGQLGRPDKQETEQIIDRSGFDHFGNLLIGKDLSTDQLSPGPYRLVIQVTDPASGAHVSQALNLNITAPRPPLWTVVSPSYHPVNDPRDAFRRGQCALSQQDRALAVYYLRQSIAAGYPGREAYPLLATAYRESGNLDAAEAAERQADEKALPTHHN
jgi:hypothetical protein